MKISIVCVGKIKEKFYRSAIDEYSKRLSRYCKLEVIEVADEKTPDNASDHEVELIKEFGQMTGFEDEEVHKKMIEIQLEKWRNERIRKQEEFGERKKIILTLSSCIGMMIILILW